jgi:hypothetical protein
MKNDHNAVLDLWVYGNTAQEISDKLGIRRGTICNIIIRNRDLGDARAVRRPVGRRKNRN